MKFAWPIVAVLVLLGASSCTQLDKAVLQEEVTEEITHTDIVTQSGGIIWTNTFYSTNYFTNYTVKPVVRSAAEATELIPGWGGLISTGLTGLLGIYASLRNRRKGKAMAEALVLANEAGRQVLLHMPDGERIDDRFKNAMIEEQIALGQANEITKVVRKVTRPRKKKTPS